MAMNRTRIAALRDKLEEQLLSVEGARRNGHPTNRLYNKFETMTFPYVSWPTTS